MLLSVFQVYISLSLHMNYVNEYQLLIFLRVLVAKGLQINQIAKSGGTALMFAAGGGHNETTRFLLDQKADVNIVVQATPEYIERVAKVTMTAQSNLLKFCFFTSILPVLLLGDCRWEGGCRATQRRRHSSSSGMPRWTYGHSSDASRGRS